MPKNQVVDETEKVRKKVLTKKYVMSAKPNSLTLENNKASYDRYFMLGGTISKMTTAAAKRYMEFKKKKHLITE